MNRCLLSALNTLWRLYQPCLPMVSTCGIWCSCLVKGVEALLKPVSFLIFPDLSMGEINMKRHGYIWGHTFSISIHPPNHILGYGLRLLGDMIDSCLVLLFTATSDVLTDTRTASRNLGSAGHLVGVSICGHSAMDRVDRSPDGRDFFFFSGLHLEQDC